MNRRKNYTSIYLLLFLLLIGVVYATLQANLQINGTAKIQSNTWDIHFDNIQVNENSVPIGTGDSAATIDPENNCKVDFEVTLSIPGDFYEFTIDVVNAGTIDGMIGELNKTLVVNNEPVDNPPEYLDYSVTYSDGDEIIENHKLTVGSTETFKVRLEYRIDIEELAPSSIISTSLIPQFVQADSSSIYRADADFASSSWDEIVKTYKIGNLTKLDQAMKAGTTRNVDLGTFGIHSVRIANLSKPEECSTVGFSQTACGFVIEFADIITTHNMDSSNSSLGGWPSTQARTYINSDIFNALPEDIIEIIVSTMVVSGHGSQPGETNNTSYDKMYLLSTHEIWLDIDNDSNDGIDYYDTAYDMTRQLDYYANLGVTVGKRSDREYTSEGNFSGAVKRYNSTKTKCWLRSANSYFSTRFYYAGEYGFSLSTDSYNNLGISPAFRIAE